MRSFLPVLLLAVAAIHFAGAPVAAVGIRGPLVGGWSPVKNVSDPHIQELGGWAVEEHARLASDGLQFRRVVRAEEQVVSGMNYRLVVDAAASSGKDAAYVAVVYEQVWTKTRELTSFKPAK